MVRSDLVVEAVENIELSVSPPKFEIENVLMMNTSASQILGHSDFNPNEERLRVDKDNHLELFTKKCLLPLNSFNE